VALAIPIGCLSLLTEAYFCTNLSDADTPASCANSESSRILLEHHVRELEQHGLLVIPDVISQTILTAAQRDIAQQQQQQLVFEPSANDSDVRHDQITWVRDDPVSDHDRADHEHQQSKQQNSIGPMYTFSSWHCPCPRKTRLHWFSSSLSAKRLPICTVQRGRVGTVPSTFGPVYHTSAPTWFIVVVTSK
jgi:hypothetical protein